MHSLTLDVQYGGGFLHTVHKIQVETDPSFIVAQVGAGTLEGGSQIYKGMTLQFDTESIPSIKKVLDVVAETTQ